MGRFDLSDEEWALIREVLPDRAATGRPPRDPRQVINGIGWIVRTGSPWRDLPKEYGPYSTINNWFRAWRKDGTWDRILQLLLVRLHECGLLDDELWCVDGTIVRATAAAAGAPEKGDVANRNPWTTLWAALAEGMGRSSSFFAPDVGFLSPSPW